MMLDGDFSTLTYCGPGQLVSFILSKTRIVNATMEIEDAHFILEDRELFVDESVIVVTCSSALLQCLHALTLIAISLMAHLRCN
jgi:hypothetical protein